MSENLTIHKRPTLVFVSGWVAANATHTPRGGFGGGGDAKPRAPTRIHVGGGVSLSKMMEAWVRVGAGLPDACDLHPRATWRPSASARRDHMARCRRAPIQKVSTTPPIGEPACIAPPCGAFLGAKHSLSAAADGNDGGVHKGAVVVSSHSIWSSKRSSWAVAWS